MMHIFTHSLILGLNTINLCDLKFLFFTFLYFIFFIGSTCTIRKDKNGTSIYFFGLKLTDFHISDMRYY